jgi:hypothetical protein
MDTKEKAKNRVVACAPGTGRTIIVLVQDCDQPEAVSAMNSAIAEIAKKPLDKADNWTLYQIIARAVDDTEGVTAEIVQGIINEQMTEQQRAAMVHRAIWTPPYSW